MRQTHNSGCMLVGTRMDSTTTDESHFHVGVVRPTKVGNVSQESIKDDQCWQNSLLQEFGAEVLRPKRLKLGLTQQQMARKIGLDQSRISRIERGLGKPEDYASARAFIVHYQLDRSDAEVWLHLLFGLPDLQVGISSPIHSYHANLPLPISEQDIFLEHLVTLNRDYLHRIYQIRLEGNPALATQMADFSSTQLYTLLQRNLSPGYREIFLRLHAEVLVEKGTVYLETCLPETVLAAVRPICIEIDEIARALGAREVVALSEMLLAGAYNINKQYDIGRRMYLQALEHAGTVDVELRVLRGLAVSASYLSDPKSVMWVASQTRSLLDGGRFSRWDQVCETLEGVGRAHGLLGSSSAYMFFDEADRVIRRNDPSPLRVLQLTVSKLEVARHIAPRDTEVLEEVGRQSLRWAFKHGYRRHANLIKGMLVQVLEK